MDKIQNEKKRLIFWNVVALVLYAFVIGSAAALIVNTGKITLVSFLILTLMWSVVWFVRGIDVGQFLLWESIRKDLFKKLEEEGVKEDASND